MSKYLAALVLVFSGVAHAALVGNGSFTTDTVSGLDWLDTAASAGMSATEALSAHSGWRLASNSEIEGIFAVAFDGYYDNFPQNGQSQSNRPHYADQLEDVVNWLSLIGPSSVSENAELGPFYYGYGLYVDEDDIWRSMGVNYREGYQHVVYGTEHVSEFQSYADNGNDLYGIYLVRSTVVPIPAAVWLFGSALFGLGWFRRAL